MECDGLQARLLGVPPGGYRMPSRMTGYLFFAFLSDEKEGSRSVLRAKTLMCRFCGEIMSYNGNTERFQRHMQSNHRTLAAAVEPDTAPASEDIVKCQVRLMSSHELPWSVFDDDLWDHLARAIVMFHRSTGKIPRLGRARAVKTKFTELHRSLRERILNDIDSSRYGRISFDCWSDQSGAYLGVLFHGVREDDSSFCALVDLCPLSSTSPKDATEISRALLEACSDPRIREAFQRTRRFASQLPEVFTADSSSVNFRAISESNMFSKAVGLPCAAHLLANCVKAAFSVVERASQFVDEVSKCVSAIVSASVFHSQVMERDRAARILVDSHAKKRGLVMHNATRWTSKFDMMSRLFEMWDFIRAELRVTETSRLIMSTSEPSGTASRPETVDEPTGRRWSLVDVPLFITAVNRERLDCMLSLMTPLHEAIIRLQDCHSSTLCTVWSSMTMVLCRIRTDFFPDFGILPSMVLSARSVSQKIDELSEPTRSNLGFVVAFAAAVCIQIRHRFFCTVMGPSRRLVPANNEIVAPAVEENAGEEVEVDRDASRLRPRSLDAAGLTEPAAKRRRGRSRLHTDDRLQYFSDALPVAQSVVFNAPVS